MTTCLNFGAGVQTTALLVLIAQDKWAKPDAIVFSDTGGEHDETYTYLHEVAMPYAKQHGMEVVVLGHDWRTAHYRQDLERYCLDHRMLPGTWARWSTRQYKIIPLAKYRKQVLGASAEHPIESWIGISTDEARRAVPSSDPAEVKRYPLIELGLSRADCAQVIADAGLSVPRKSGCWFCPFQKRSQWQHLKRERPDLFERAMAMERNAVGKDGKRKYLPMFGSLEEIAGQEEIPGFDEAIEAEGGCVSGYCHA